MDSRWSKLRAEIVNCDRCPRLREHCLTVAREKRKAYIDDVYWGRPIAGFGDPDAQLVLVGLAPAAHGANRTGRIFTGDRSGDWLYRALHKAGFANQPTSTTSDDGLKLNNAYVTCTVRCAPPDNKPLPDEHSQCLPYLKREFEMLTRARVYIALGQIAFKYSLQLLPGRPTPLPKFGHGQQVQLTDGKLLIASFHPSQQNTFTGRLTEPMFDQAFNAARKWLETGV